jgi:chemotaxis protein CheX
MKGKNYTIDTVNGSLVINLNQQLDYFYCKLFIAEIPKLMETPKNVFINCQRVVELPKDWIRALMLLSMNLRKAKCELKLLNVPTSVMTSLKREGIDQYFTIAKSISENKEVVKRKLDMEFINPFLTATLRVLKIQANTEALPQKPYLKKTTDLLKGDISGIIGIVSDAFTGSVTISFPQDTFLNIMSRMLGEEIHTFGQEITDGAGEITNMIFGQAKIDLNEKGYGIKTALPSIINGKDHSLSTTRKGTVMVIPFETEVGNFFVEIGLSD